MTDALVIALIVVTSYFIIVFVLSRFFIPHLGWRKEKLPEDIPAVWQSEIDNLKKRAASRQEFLSLAYDYLGQKYTYSAPPFFRRFQVFPNFPTLFTSLSGLYERKGFMHCTQLNLLLRLFLTKSGFFREEDIRIKHVFVNFFIHQYLQIKVDGAWLDVDLFGYSSGLKIGQSLKFFNF